MLTLDGVAMIIAVFGIIALSLWPLKSHSLSDNHDNSAYTDELSY